MRGISFLGKGPGLWPVLFLLLVTACQTAEVTPEGTLAPAPTESATPEIGVTLATRAPPTMAVVQTTPTPLPTPTATPTATPIVYEVQEGDTLLGIAIQNYTTVEEIEAQNPGVVPELLQIGQTLVLPPPATPVFDGELPTQVPLQVTVRSVQVVRTPVGSMWLMGEVLNEGQAPAAGVQVQIDLIGAEGTSLLTVPAWVVPAIVAPGETAPFAVLVQEPPAGDVQPVVAVVGGESLARQGTYYLDLAVAAGEVTIEDGQLRIEGTVENVGQQTASEINVIATFYGNRNEVTGYSRQALTEPLAPGSSGSFSMEAAPPGGPSVDHSLSVYGLIQ